MKGDSSRAVIEPPEVRLSGETRHDTLDPKGQSRNLIIYVGNVCLVFLGAPVIYIGIVQAALCERLGASDTVANLPAVMYVSLAAFPILAAWYLPYVRLLKWVVVAGYSTMAIMGALVAATLLLPAPSGVKIAALVLHGAVLGAAIGVVNTFEWEVLIRGVPESRRGRAFSLALGLGPILAVLGSLCSQLVLSGKIGSITIGMPQFPRNFALLYGATMPAMALAAFQSGRYVIPAPAVENVRQPFVAEVFGGFDEFFRHRLILITCLAFVLLYAGQMVMPNMTLFTREAVGELAEKYVGYQDGLRFAFKVAAGFFLGWLLTHTSPKMTLVVTASLSLLGVVWALAVTGRWFLLSFGFLGAGELAYAYFSYYILCCSSESKMRRNMAFFYLIQEPVAFAPLLYGRISNSFGLRLSFWMAIVLMAASALLVIRGVVPRPHPASQKQ